MHPQRRHRWRRSAPFAPLALLGLAVLTLASCASNAPQDTFKPEGPFAKKTDNLAKPVFATAVIIGILVYLAIAVVVVKYRRKNEDDVPVQVHGSTPLEIGWTIIPAALLVVVGVFSVGRIWDLAKEPKDAYHITVIGHQWWWEYHYPPMGSQSLTPVLAHVTDKDTGKVTAGVPEETGPAIVSAGELHIPTGKNIRLTIMSQDVMHNYWVPKLAGKIYAIPGKINKLSMRSNVAKTFYGQCAEFCGTSHANMRFKVIAQTPDQFNAWLQSQVGKAHDPGKPAKNDSLSAAAGKELFNGVGGCSTCHYVDSSKANDVAHIGPNLSHVAQRKTFAGATETFDARHLRAWLRSPQAVKPGAKMKIGKLTEDQITALVAYIQSLK